MKILIEKIIIFIILVVLVSFIPKTDKACVPNPELGPNFSECSTVQVSGIGYPMIYGESFTGSSSSIELNITNLIINIIIYYSISSFIIYVYKQRMHQIGFVLNSLIIFIVNFTLAILMFPRYIDAVQGANLSVAPLVFTLCYVALFITQITIFFKRKSLKTINYRSGFIFAYISIFFVLITIYTYISLNKGPVLISIAPLVILSIPIFFWFIFILMSWVKLLNSKS